MFPFLSTRLSKNKLISSYKVVIFKWNFACFAALVSVSEEVRSRCHLKHRVSQYVMTDSPSSDSISAELNTPGITIGTSASAHSMSTTPIQTPSNATASMTPVTRRQKSCDILDKSAISVARNNTHLMQNQVSIYNCNFFFYWHLSKICYLYFWI